MKKKRISTNRQTASISEIHRLTGLDRATIGKYIRHLVPVGEGRKNSIEYYLDEVLGVIIHTLRARNDGSSKQRKELAQAEQAEITVAKMRAELVPSSLMRSSAEQLVKSLSERCVMLAPPLLADKITGSTDHNETEIVIREHLAMIFEELRSSPNNFLKIPTDAP